MNKFLLFTLLLVACNTNNGFGKAEDAEDAGREFIRASLDGDYRKAMFYLYKDSTDTNMMLLDKWKKNYDQLPAEEKMNFKDASIRAIRIENKNDSTAEFVYSNSYKPRDTTTIRIIRINNDWLVDLKDIH
jgi:predicted small secreted protein